MNLNLVLPFISTLVMIIFTLSVFQRWLVRKKPHFLFWSAGLAMFTIGIFAEAYFAVIGWSAFVFFLWYFFGAITNAAYIGHGTYWLLTPTFNRSPFAGDNRSFVKYVVRPILLFILFFLRRPRMMTGLLIGATMVAFLMMLQVMPLLDTSSFSASAPISEQYREIMPPVAEGGVVRLTTPFFNIYGLVTLVGGALWSAALFLRKKVLPNRVIGNVLIAIGALSIAFASTLTRLGLGAYLYLGELIAAVLMYTGFLVASAPATEAESVSEPAIAQ